MLIKVIKTIILLYIFTWKFKFKFNKKIIKVIKEFKQVK